MCSAHLFVHIIVHYDQSAGKIAFTGVKCPLGGNYYYSMIVPLTAIMMNFSNYGVCIYESGILGNSLHNSRPPAHMVPRIGGVSF